MLVSGAAGCAGSDPPADDVLAPTATTTSATTPSSSTTVPTYTGDADSPFCNLLREVDVSSILAGDQEDPDQLGRAFRAVVDVLVQAAELAPPEIQADVALVADGMSSLDAALAEVGYSFDQLAASGANDEVRAAVNDPAFVDAGIRMGAYRAQVCGL